MPVSLLYHDDPAFAERDAPREAAPGPRSVLITGAAGRVGRCVAAAARERGDLRLRLMIENESQRERVEGFDDVVIGDIRDALSIRPAFDDIDTVVHLAANPRFVAAWKDLVGPNVEGVHNVFEAAADAGCRNVVAASSVHAVISSTTQDRPVDEEQPNAPGNFYGVTKALAEGLGRVYALDHRMSVLCVRLGGVMSLEGARKHTAKRPWWERLPITYDDASQFFLRCIDDTKVRFGIFHALSEAENSLMDISRAREVLGFQPTRLTTEGAETHTSATAST